MSTVTTRYTAVQPAAGILDGNTPRSQTPTDGVQHKRSALSRLFNWYRKAVTTPATEQEADDWRKHSF